jgi:hypothetical protein
MTSYLSPRQDFPKNFYIECSKKLEKLFVFKTIRPEITNYPKEKILINLQRLSYSNFNHINIIVNQIIYPMYKNCMYDFIYYKLSDYINNLMEYKEFKKTAENKKIINELKAEFIKVFQPPSVFVKTVNSLW